jgi:hypothetical protein
MRDLGKRGLVFGRSEANDAKDSINSLPTVKAGLRKVTFHFPRQHFLRPVANEICFLSGPYVLIAANTCPHQMIIRNENFFATEKSAYAAGGDGVAVRHARGWGRQIRRR